MSLVHNFNVHLSGEGDALIEAQVVQAHLGASFSETLEEIYDLNLDGRLRAEMLIVRLPVEENWDPADLEVPQTDAARRHLGAAAERDRVFARGSRPIRAPYGVP